MRRAIVGLAATWVMVWGAVSMAEEVSVGGERCVVVLPAQADEWQMTAAKELAKHLQLVTGQTIPTTRQGEMGEGQYGFYVGMAAPGDGKALAAEEARWVVKTEGTYLYGEGKVNGSLFAVYGFLEEQLGVRWIEPGDRGIAYVKQSPVKLQKGEYHWAPSLRQRKIRVRDKVVKELQTFNVKGDLALFDSFRRTLEENNQDAVEGIEWQRRMRMGGHNVPSYGHGFTTWWKLYGQAHPDYFAMRPDGQRAPAEMEATKSFHTADNPKGWQNIKLCCSNPAVVDQIIKNWIVSGKRTHSINVCENDDPPAYYCSCEECRKLDVPKAGERDLQHLSDRYVHLANAVAREARKHDPEAEAVMIAYNPTERAPRRERLDPNVCVTFTPTTVVLEALQEQFGEWKKAGAMSMVMRPNYHWYYATTSMPLGFEKHMFDVFQVAVANGCIGADFDGIKRNWPTTGMFNYILAKAMSDPSKPYEYWEDHYLRAYGEAGPEVKEYYRYWRTELWEKRLHPGMGTLLQGQDANFGRAVLKQLGNYYQASDFDRAGAILAKGSQRKLDEPAKAKLEQLMLANEHARLVFAAATTPLPGKLEHARKLLAFRREHEKDLSVTWIDIIAMELAYLDTGLAAVVEK